MIALGEIGSVAQAREILSRSVAKKRITNPSAAWDEAYDRFRALAAAESV
ncbi:MAG: hypothetical protein U0521_26055 [Anaerolineae bacterium]